MKTVSTFIENVSRHVAEKEYVKLMVHVLDFQLRKNRLYNF